MSEPRPPAIERIGIDEIPFQGIVEQALAGVYVVYDERFRYANGIFASMFGYRIDEMEGMHMRDLVTLDSGDDVMEKYRQRISGEVQQIRYVTKCRHKDGHVVHLEIHGARVLFRGQPALSGIAIDITERVERQLELTRSREQLRALAGYVNTSREEQRAMFARDVHDVLGGMLSSIKMDVTRMVRRAAAPELVEIRNIGAELLTLVQETIDDARRIANEARPRILDSLGLVAALKEMLEKFGERSDVVVSFTLEGVEPTLSTARSIQCYRIVQEALTNVGRHANAQHVWLRIAARADGFDLEVADDGRGIDSDAMRRGGIGLVSMAERAREIGGTLDANPVASGGTSIMVWVPLVERGRAP